MDKFTLMRLSEEMDDDAVEPQDLDPALFDAQSPAEAFRERYRAFYDDVKVTPKEDW